MVHLNVEGKKSLGSGIAFTVLATVAVTLRLLTKLYTKGAWAADDSWAIASLLSLFAWTGVEFWGIFSAGGGENIGELILAQDFATARNYMKSLYTLEALYILTVTTTKLTILYLYRRIFAVPRFRQASSIVIVVCIVWWLVSTIVNLLPCLPPQKLWEPQRKGYCYNFDTYFLCISTTEIIIDTAILTLPVKMVLGLQMSFSRRVKLCLIFMLGSFVVVTGIVRLILVYVPHALNINFTQGELWTNIHLGTAILCASLPTYGPFFSQLAFATASIRSKFNSMFSSRRPLQSSKASGGFELGNNPGDHKRYKQLEPGLEGTALTEAAATHGSRQSTNDRKDDAWDSQIRVKHTIDVV